MVQIMPDKLFEQLLTVPSETEWLEFKEAKNDFSFDELGKYFSALSNEANLKLQTSGWLVFGVTNTPPRQVVGTSFKSRVDQLNKIKHDIAQHTNNHLTFTEIFDVTIEGKRVLLFQIPPAPTGMPVSWKGFNYGRDGESLVPLNTSEYETIRRQALPDWSAQICEGASLLDLDPAAIQKAREEYLIKHPSLAEELLLWDDATFLNKAKVTIQGKITNTALLLLGKQESEHFLSPGIARISWILKDEHNREKDYQHFGLPLIIRTEEVLKKVRNLTYRYMPDNSLFPIEITQYDAWVIREALHNCIAHQDYTLRSKVIVIERQDEILFVNAGNFIPKTVESVIEQDAPQMYYRNEFLVQAMVELNMIDSIGSGIKRMYEHQRNRFFPMPAYDLSDAQAVKVTIYGRILDENYTRLLTKRSDLSLRTIILLDKVQKKVPLFVNEIRKLRKLRLIEGRATNLYVTARLADTTVDKATYIRNRSFDDAHYKKLILSYIKNYKKASRHEIDSLLLDKLSDVLSQKQKKDKIKNLLYQMAHRDKSIINTGAKKTPCWELIV